MNINTLQILVTLIWPPVQQYLENSSWFKLLSQDSAAAVKRAASIIAAMATSLGITISCDFQVAHSCTINGLDWHTVWTFAVRVTLQFLGQHVFHTALNSTYGKGK